MFVLVRVRKEARQSNLAVTTAVDFIPFHLTLPGGHRYLEYDSYLKHNVVQLQPQQALIDLLVRHAYERQANTAHTRMNTCRCTFQTSIKGLI